MPRSRSRSPGRRGGERSHRRSRSRSRSRERRRRHRSRSPGGGGGGGSSRHHRKHSSRSRSPTHRRRDRSKSPDIFNKPSSSKAGRGGEPEVTTGATNPDLLSPEMQIPVDGEVTQEAIDMIQLMGFSGFDTSKGKAHTDGSVKAHGSSIQVKRKYRQYMNRRGGFNRPLDKVA